GELLHHDRRVEEVGAGASVGLGRVHAQEALLAGAPPGLPIAHPARAPLRELGRHLALDEAPHLGPEELVFLAEGVASHGGEGSRGGPAQAPPRPRRRSESPTCGSPRARKEDPMHGRAIVTWAAAVLGCVPVTLLSGPSARRAGGGCPLPSAP